MSDTETAPKRQRLASEGDPDARLSANSDSLPSIFKLNNDCFNEIFDYLSLPELHSFGQTCKAINRLASAHFRSNYGAAAKFSGDNGIYTEYSDHHGVINQRTQTSGFNRNITYISHYYERMAPLYYIQSHRHELTSINHIYLVCVTLNATRIKCIQTILNKAKVVQIRNCSVDDDFYHTFLQHCKCIERLYVQDVDISHHRQSQRQPWLCQSYSTLQHLELVPQYSNHLDDIAEFFQRNPNIRSFSTSAAVLWQNRDAFFKCAVKLDVLEVKMFRSAPNRLGQNVVAERELMRLTCNLLNQLYKCGLFERLHFFVQNAGEANNQCINSLHGLEKLCIKQLDVGFKLSQRNDLSELVILNCANANVKNMEQFAKTLPILQRLFLQNASFDILLPFARHSANLNRVKWIPEVKKHSNHHILNLLSLDKEREKLFAARKITIFVPDYVFLMTKWTTNYGNTIMNSIEMKRTDSFVWNQHF